jgi:hypothetical protein
MSPLRLTSTLIVALACMTIAASPSMRPAFAQTQAQARIVKFFDNGNVYAVQNQSTRSTTFTLSKPTHLTKIMTYHWNDGFGTKAGTIALRKSTGEIYGPWETEGLPGQGGVPSAYWVVEGDLELPAGTYTIVDSDPSTWAQNAGTRGAGMASAEGYRD